MTVLQDSSLRADIASHLQFSGSQDYPDLKAYVDHCVGKDRLLGEYYGTMLTEALDLPVGDSATALSELCVTLRSYVVLDDYVKDNSLTNTSVGKTNSCLAMLKAKILEYLDEFSSSGSRLWTRYHSTYEYANREVGSSSAFIRTQRRCAFLFLPFDLPIVREHLHHAPYLRHQVAYYLFSLQLLDDFSDMAEDLIAPVNHSLFTAELEPAIQSCLMQLRPHLAFPVLNYIARNLWRIRELPTHSTILSSFIETALKWLKPKCGDPGVDCTSFYRIPYEQYSFLNHLFTLLPMRRTASDSLIGEISAESMHTQRIGVSHDYRHG